MEILYQTNKINTIKHAKRISFAYNINLVKFHEERTLVIRKREADVIIVYLNGQTVAGTKFA